MNARNRRAFQKAFMNVGEAREVCLERTKWNQWSLPLAVG